MTLTTEAAPGTDTWDPLAAPYVTTDCRRGRHSQCLGGMIYYPDGWEGTRIEIRCTCAATDCPCSKVPLPPEVTS
jgi:hypothetical protein